MSLPYPSVNSTLAGQNVMYLFQYANDVTNDLFVPLMVLAFFIVVLVASLGLQFKFTGRIRFETSFVAACFAVLGFAVILEQMTGLLSPLYFLIIILVTVVSVVTLILSPD